MKKIVLAVLVGTTLLIAACGGYRHHGKAKMHGEIISVDMKNETITLRSKNGLQETFSVDATTKMYVDRWTGDGYIKFSELKAGDELYIKYVDPSMKPRGMEPMPTGGVKQMKKIRSLTVVHEAE